MTPGRPDAVAISRHLYALRAAITNLRRHAGCTVANLRSDRDLRWAVERGLQLCAQNVLDIATHLAITSGLDTPDYTSAIDRLAELGVLNSEFAARFRAIGGFRNVLVHGYLDVDLKVIERALVSGLSDFEHFAAAVETFMQDNG